MKKYQVTWGWEPPRYEVRNNGNVRVFFASEKKTETRERIDPETEEATSEEVTLWLCDVAEYEKGVEDDMELITLVKQAPESDGCQRALLRARVKAYDKSAHVEDFTIGGIHLWLDSTLRSKVKENLETCVQLGEENTTLRFEGMAFPVTVEQGWQMYYAVLAYARDSWNVTENHLQAIESLTTAEEMKAYDYTAGYPEKLAF